MGASRLAVIVPSRGRPGNIIELWNAWEETGSTAELIVGLDDDDPELGAYPYIPFISYSTGPRLRMVGTLNRIATEIAPFYDYLGFMGDDHRPRTLGWDADICRTLDEHGTGFAYGNDLIQGALLPTAVFMTSDVVRRLGWMALPGCRHLFVDTAWLALGERVGITYLPQVIIEHLHPIAGKAEWDAGYSENNDGETWSHDEAVYKTWLVDGLERDAAKICG